MERTVQPESDSNEPVTLKRTRNPDGIRIIPENTADEPLWFSDDEFRRLAHAGMDLLNEDEPR